MIAECDPAHPTTPKLTFFGAMQAPETSTMMGWVKMTVDNQVHWHFVSWTLFLSWLDLGELLFIY